MTVQNRTSSAPRGNVLTKREEATPQPRYIDLWEEGIRCGLIGKNRPSEHRYYHMIYRKSLLARLKDYKEASSAAAKARLAAKFERDLAAQCERQEELGTSAEVTTSLPRSNYQVPVWPALANRAAAVEKEKSPKQATLAELWSKSKAIGLLTEEFVFSPSIHRFITASELQLLIKEYEAASKEEKATRATAFSSQVASFEATIPSVARYFKVSPGYEQIWEKAVTAGLLPKTVTYRSEYAEWVSARDLVAATYTLKSLLSREDRATARLLFFDHNLALRLKLADSCLQYRAHLATLSRELLLEEGQKRLPVAVPEPTYFSCQSCASLLRLPDLITAISTWAYCPEEEARSRYQRWDEFRTALHRRHSS